MTLPVSTSFSILAFTSLAMGGISLSDGIYHHNSIEMVCAVCLLAITAMAVTTYMKERCRQQEAIEVSRVSRRPRGSSGEPVVLVARSVMSGAAVRRA